MKTASVQTESAADRRRFDYSKDKHYVSVQAPDATWEGDQLDQLLDTIDPLTGESAYTIEADGSTVDGRRVTGNRRKVLLSCSKEFSQRKAAENSNASREQASQIAGARAKSVSLGGVHVGVVEDENFGLRSQSLLPAGIIGA